MGRSPMLYVQLKIGINILPAIVDSGACDNFISAQTVAEMHLEVRHLQETMSVFTARCVLRGLQCCPWGLVVPTEPTGGSIVDLYDFGISIPASI